MYMYVQFLCHLFTLPSSAVLKCGHYAMYCTCTCTCSSYAVCSVCVYSTFTGTLTSWKAGFSQHTLQTCLTRALEGSQGIPSKRKQLEKTPAEILWSCAQRYGDMTIAHVHTIVHMTYKYICMQLVGNTMLQYTPSQWLQGQGVSLCTVYTYTHVQVYRCMQMCMVQCTSNLYCLVQQQVYMYSIHAYTCTKSRLRGINILYIYSTCTISL